MMTGEGDTRTRSSIFWAMGFSRGDRRIGTASTSSTSARPFPTKRGSRSARRFEAGICIYAVTRQSKICRECSIQRSGVGCNTTGGIIARPCTLTCVNWTARWPIGRTGNTRSCAVICAGQRIGLRAFRGGIRSCLRTGRWASGVAPWREPYELRGSSTVLREPRGEIPRGYSPRDPGEEPQGRRTRFRPHRRDAGFAAPAVERGQEARGALLGRFPLPGGDLPRGPSAAAVETGPQAPAGALRCRSLAARFLPGKRAPAVAPVSEFLMGLAQYSDKNRSLRICERIGWQAKAPAPRACRAFGSKGGQTLSFVRGSE